MLNKLNRGAVHPDETNLTQNPPKNGGGDNRNQRMPMMPAFLPNQQNMLAQQLAAGFGGGQNHWMNRLGNIYSPMQQIQPFDYDLSDNKKKDKKDDDGNGNGRPTTPDTPVTDPWGRNKAAAGLMAAQPQQVAQGGGLVALNPQTLALIRQMQFGGR